jgi:hypothetical protein
MDIAGHVSRQMLARYSHIRMEAKRKALEGIIKRPVAAPEPRRDLIADGKGGSAQPLQ